MDDCKIIVFKDEHLTAIETDNIFEEIYALKKNNEYTIKLNLQSLEFIDPYGLTSLCLIGRYLKDNYKKVCIDFGNNYRLQSYLSTMNFPVMMKDCMDFKDSEYISNDVHESELNVLLELTEVDSGDTNARVYINTISAKIGSILKNELHFKAKETSDFCSIITELCYNIRDHSEDKGFITVQKYTKSNGRNFVIIGVGDLGIGIKESLSKRYNVSNWSHLEAIINSLKKGYSSKGDRGYGLHFVKNVIFKYSGEFHIRSGDTRIFLNERYRRGFPGYFFPGTQTSIKLYEK